MPISWIRSIVRTIACVSLLAIALILTMLLMIAGLIYFLRATLLLLLGRPQSAFWGAAVIIGLTTQLRDSEKLRNEKQDLAA